jgi:hypothetical protein
VQNYTFSILKRSFCLGYLQTISPSEKNSQTVMCRSILSPGKGYKSRFASGAKLANCAHGPVLQISKKQNRELQFARRGRADRSCQDKFCRWLNPDKRGRIYLSLRNYLKLLEVCFLDLLCHITARWYS